MRRGVARGRATTLDVLRARTTAAHHRLDGALVDPDLVVRDEATYVRLLEVLHHLHSRTEAPLHAWVRRTSWARGRLDGVDLPVRAELYADDLRGLGTAPAPTVPDPPYDDAGGIAALYLLAGTTKGARALRRRLPDDVAADDRRGLDDATAPASRRLWPAVHGLLVDPQEQASQPELAAAAAARACDVFADLQARVGLPGGIAREPAHTSLEA